MNMMQQQRNVDNSGNYIFSTCASLISSDAGSSHDGNQRIDMTAQKQKHRKQRQLTPYDDDSDCTPVACDIEEECNLPLPPGWAIAQQVSDGKVYYWEMESGRTSWTHPLEQNNTIGDDNNSKKSLGSTYDKKNPPPEPAVTLLAKNLLSKNRQPPSHLCCAVFSLLVMPPIGLCAVWHAKMAERTWMEGRYEKSIHHSRQSHNYAWFGVVLAIVVFVCIWIARLRGRAA